MKFFPIALFVLMGCTEFDQTIEYKVDERLTKYVDRFYRESEQRGFSFQRNNLLFISHPNLLVNEGVLAITRRKPGKQILIEIDEDLLKANDSLFLEFTVMHEFGHAFLNREHNKKYSIMHHSQATVAGYRRNDRERKILLDELFFN